MFRSAKRNSLLHMAGSAYEPDSSLARIGKARLLGKLNGSIRGCVLQAAIAQCGRIRHLQGPAHRTERQRKCDNVEYVQPDVLLRAIPIACHAD